MFNSGMQVLNRIFVEARANIILESNGWHYLGCNCTTKAVGEEGDCGCRKCEDKAEEPVPSDRPSGHTIFAALDSEVQRIVHTTASDVVMMGEQEEGKCKVVAAFENTLNVEMDQSALRSTRRIKYSQLHGCKVSFPYSIPNSPSLRSRALNCQGSK
ncbi:hypothetical protein C5167_004886 [Papaver somniferum]|uniref:Uncharacterized protein n=1 Tax=Papaver somniferum TaxID=3469 RepID=A0A4Y7JD64_PAPSO|nr:hypothetical protein C5167_004886 [Papaver somniferum]